MSEFVAQWNKTAKEIHDTAVSKGWYDEQGERNLGEAIALAHSELSEVLEALRHGNPKSDKIPQFTAVEEELADLVIRVMDLSVFKNYRIAEAIEAKTIYNKTRPKKHGKLF